MTISPTQRTLKYLREKGYICAITEHWNAFARIRRDLFNFIDILALDTVKQEIVAVQTTSGANVSARIKKMQALPEFKAWKECGGRAIVIGWRKAGAAGKAKRWLPRIAEVWILHSEDIEL